MRAKARFSDCLIRSERQRQSKGARDPRVLGRVGLQAVGDVPLLDVLCRTPARPRGIVEQDLPLLDVHHAEQVARLLVVVVIDPVVPVIADTVDLQRGGWAPARRVRPASRGATRVLSVMLLLAAALSAPGLAYAAPGGGGGGGFHGGGGGFHGGGGGGFHGGGGGFHGGGGGFHGGGIGGLH